MQPNLSEAGDLTSLILAHQWVAVAALLVGLVVRLLKSDTPIPVDVPARWRPWLAIGLGMVAGSLQALARGVPWKDALAGGLVAGIAAILGHDLVVESLRGGRELGQPKAKDDDKGDPPTPPPAVLGVLVLTLLSGCVPKGAESPARDTARAVGLLVAEGAQAADVLCADFARARSDEKLAKTCADAYDVVRASLLSAQNLVDGWERVDHRAYLCAVGSAVEALSHVSEAVVSAGGPKMPPLVEDALTLGSALSHNGCP